ncbi:hypothetical protein QQM39_01015 [Streptomyces sp. DT2A-34]|uniref:hypothetical protein n=1 Tax=Streptomyces sp. DT2A-34 TaxID=3051182 RepID=UPI00265C320F|nr:hypothetical protein [Streptomyces sp. DT2A-34]MDO0909487.1 hypothetical protein [Streptomyces sp. DT2A-34]
MGLDITVLAVDWERLESTAVGRRLELLEDAAFPDIELDWDAGPEGGWVCPAAPDLPWCARYVFHRTSGSYKPHFWAGQAWDDVREFAEPGLREGLDGFLRDLFWHDDPVTPPLDGLVHDADDPRRPGLLVACPPKTVSALAARWAGVEPSLEGLRAAYDVHAARPGGWIEDFDGFAVLLREWAVVVRAAEQRGWGLLGLPW